MRNQQELFGYNFTKGILRAVFGRELLIIIIIVSLVVFLKKDDSDAGYFKRSGLKLHTDYKTGVQYLSNKHGGLCPRFDKNGYVVVANEKNK